MAVTLPEHAVVLAAVGAAIAANGQADFAFKPLLFNAFGLNAAKREQERQQEASAMQDGSGSGSGSDALLVP